MPQDVCNLGCSVAECLPTMHKVLGSILSTGNRQAKAYKTSKSPTTTKIQPYFQIVSFKRCKVQMWSWESLLIQYKQHPSKRGALGADADIPKGKIMGGDKVERGQAKMKAETRVMQLQMQD